MTIEAAYLNELYMHLSPAEKEQVISLIVSILLKK